MSWLSGMCELIYRCSTSSVDRYVKCQTTKILLLIIKTSNASMRARNINLMHYVKQCWGIKMRADHPCHMDQNDKKLRNMNTNRGHTNLGTSYWLGHLYVA